MAGATEGIQSAEEGGSTLWQARAQNDFLSHFSRSFEGVKTYYEKKKIFTFKLVGT